MTRKTGDRRDRRVRPIEQKRRAARLAAVQALYQMDLAGTDLNDVISQIGNRGADEDLAEETAGAGPIDDGLFRELVTGVFTHQQRIDRDVHGTLAGGWKLERLDATLRAILRAGAFELGWRKKVTAGTVINEYLEVAHAFYDGDEPGFVNGVLDALARRGQGGEQDNAGAGTTQQDTT